MQFSLDASEREVQENISSFLSRRAPVSVDRVVDLKGLYCEMGHLGFFSLSVPEAAGGLGLPFFMAGLFALAAGRELLPGPWLEHLLALEAMVAAGAGATELSPALAGRRLEAFAFTEVRLSHHPAKIEGRLPRVPAGVQRRVLLASSDSSVGPVLIAVGTTGQGIAEQPLESVDLTWDGVSVDYESVAVESQRPLPKHTIGELANKAAILAAAAAIGASDRLLEDTVAYVLSRHQFDRPIGSFQAVKHRLADLYINLEHVRNLVLAALAHEDGERTRLAPMAKVMADQVYRSAAETALQLHGGLGFTWECPVHLYLKNSLRLRTVPVSSSHHRHLVGARLAIL
jgi:alkylation response protein AidB-like acyl-CoA dehydrogenase